VRPPADATPAVAASKGTLIAEVAEALAGVIGVPCPDFSAGEPLPLLWHWAYLLDRPAQTDLGPDGHQVRGLLSRYGSGHRRMFGGGRVSVARPLLVGGEATRYSRVVATTKKRGRSGPLTLVTVRHEIVQNGHICINDEQDVVYRANPTGGAGGEGSLTSVRPSNLPVAPRPTTDGRTWSIPVDPVLLFRFSALTYNAHRIHYDRDYATRVEGYPGLVVHGPFQVLAMAELARSRMNAVPWGRFEYRLVAPLFDSEGMLVMGQCEARGFRGWVTSSAGRVTATGLLNEARASAADEMISPLKGTQARPSCGSAASLCASPPK
jgi:3-methylfumaryl-CoA hydratase